MLGNWQGKQLGNWHGATTPAAPGTIYATMTGAGSLTGTLSFTTGSPAEGGNWIIQARRRKRRA